MRKISLIAAVAAAFVLIGVGKWVRPGSSNPSTAVAGSTLNSTMIAGTTGAKGLPTSLYDDYSLVVN